MHSLQFLLPVKDCRPLLALVAAVAVASGAVPVAAQPGSWNTLLSKKAVFPPFAGGGRPQIVPFSIPEGRATYRFTITAMPFPPSGFGFSGVGTAVQWGLGTGEPSNFTGSFADVCALGYRPGGWKKPEPTVQGAEVTTVSYSHNDSGRPCRQLWAALFPSVRVVNGTVAQQLASTIVLTIEYQMDGPGGEAATTGAVNQPAAAPSSTPAPKITGAIAGTWNWVDGQTLVVNANGTVEVYDANRTQINQGTWVSLGGNQYRLTHRNGGYVDDVTVSPDGNVLDGINNVGYRLHGTRRGGAPAATPSAMPVIAGTWNWVSGQTLVIHADGTMEAFAGAQKINYGTWVHLGGRRYRLSHRNGGWEDEVTLSMDGRSLDGTNNAGAGIHGTRR